MMLAFHFSMMSRPTKGSASFISPSGFENEVNAAKAEAYEASDMFVSSFRPLPDSIMSAGVRARSVKKKTLKF